MVADDRIREIVVDTLGVDSDEVVPKANFKDDLGADSLGLFRLFEAIDEEFDVEIDYAVAEESKLKTVGDAMDFIVALQ